MFSSIKHYMLCKKINYKVFLSLLRHVLKCFSECPQLEILVSSTAYQKYIIMVVMHKKNQKTLIFYNWDMKNLSEIVCIHCIWFALWGIALSSYHNLYVLKKRDTLQKKRDSEVHARDAKKRDALPRQWFYSIQEVHYKNKINNYKFMWKVCCKNDARYMVRNI